MTHPTDEMVLEELQNGNTVSLGILYERYKTLLFNYFLKVTTDRDVSSDLLMETFERVYKYRGSYKSKKKVRPWLFQIASNLINDYYRTTNPLVAVDSVKVVDESDIPQYAGDASERTRLLQQAMNELKPDQRNMVTMYYLLEMSYNEIALAEGITVNNARIKICRSLKRLNTLLKHSGI